MNLEELEKEIIRLEDIQEIEAEAKETNQTLRLLALKETFELTDFEFDLLQTLYIFREFLLDLNFFCRFSFYPSFSQSKHIL